MDRSPFVTIRCPACASTDVSPRAAGQFTCRHCGSAFLYAPQPAATQPGPPISAPASAATAAAASRHRVLAIAVGVTTLAAVCGVTAALRPRTDRVTPSIHEARTESRNVPAPAPVVTPLPSLREAPKTRPTVAAAPPPTPTPATADEPPSVDTPLPLSSYQRLQGCGCKGSPPVTLFAHAAGTTTMITGGGMTIRRNLDFALDRGEPTPWRLPTDDTTAPASAYEVSNVPIAVGCRDDVVVIAAGTAVSAWSMDRRTLLWSRTLPEPYGEFGGEAREFVLDCNALRVGKHDVTIRSGRSRTSFALTDGSAN